MSHFHIERTTAILGLTVYTLGLGFGPIISAPLSEKYGRKIVYMTSSPIFMLFILGAGFSKSLASLIICRFLAGLTGSPALAIGAGTNADLFLPRQRAVVTSMFLMAPFLGPALGYVNISLILGSMADHFQAHRWWLCSTVQRLALDAMVCTLHHPCRLYDRHSHARNLQTHHSEAPSEETRYHTSSN
jgi:MFS family permease